MRSFALLLAVVAAAALVAPLLAQAQECNIGDGVLNNKACNDNKRCCLNIDTTNTFDYACYNVQRSDDHCGSCGRECSGTYSRCLDGVCGTKAHPLKRITRDCFGVPMAPVPANPATVGTFKFTRTGPAISRQLNTYITITGATDGVTYSVRVIQLGGTDPCGAFSVPSTFTTDSLGRATYATSEPLVGTSAFVYLDRVNANPSDPAEQISSEVIRTTPSSA